MPVLLRFFRRRWSVAWSGICIAAALILFISCTRPNPEQSNDHVLEVWHGWPQQEADSLRRAITDFEKTHPHIHVRLSYAANNLTSNQKLFLAIAGGVGPDITFVDGQQLAEWAARGALTDITDAARSARCAGR